MSNKIKQHESYGMIRVNKFTGNGSQFFGSDIVHNGGMSITISSAEVERGLSSEWYHDNKELIRIQLSSSQFVDAITSGMNTSGVPCTIIRFNNKGMEQIDHIDDKIDEFNVDMVDTQTEYLNKIDNILNKLEGTIGKKKAEEITHDLRVLKSHISSNTNFVMKCFNEAMEKAVTEAKHSVSNYIDNKVHSMGIEAMRNELNQISISAGDNENGGKVF